MTLAMKPLHFYSNQLASGDLHSFPFTQRQLSLANWITGNEMMTNNFEHVDLVFRWDNDLCLLRHFHSV